LGLQSNVSKAGHSRVRWLLIQAARSILRCQPPAAEALWTWALRIAARRGKYVAVVALADPPRVRSTVLIGLQSLLALDTKL
jgi:Transposase IS116/IS110/IS902 family